MERLQGVHGARILSDYAKFDHSVADLLGRRPEKLELESGAFRQAFG